MWVAGKSLALDLFTLKSPSQAGLVSSWLLIAPPENEGVFSRSSKAPPTLNNHECLRPCLEATDPFSQNALRDVAVTAASGKEQTKPDRGLSTSQILSPTWKLSGCRNGRFLRLRNSPKTTEIVSGRTSSGT